MGNAQPTAEKPPQKAWPKNRVIIERARSSDTKQRANSADSRRPSVQHTDAKDKQEDTQAQSSDSVPTEDFVPPAAALRLEQLRQDIEATLQGHQEEMRRIAMCKSQYRGPESKAPAALFLRPEEEVLVTTAVFQPTADFLARIIPMDSAFDSSSDSNAASDHKPPPNLPLYVGIDDRKHNNGQGDSSAASRHHVRHDSPLSSADSKHSPSSSVTHLANPTKWPSSRGSSGSHTPTRRPSLRSNGSGSTGIYTNNQGPGSYRSNQTSPSLHSMFSGAYSESPSVRSVASHFHAEATSFEPLHSSFQLPQPHSLHSHTRSAHAHDSAASRTVATGMGPSARLLTAAMGLREARTGTVKQQQQHQQQHQQYSIPQPTKQSQQQQQQQQESSAQKKKSLSVIEEAQLRSSANRLSDVYDGTDA